MDKRKIGEEKKIKQRELLTMEEICINCACSTPVSYENFFFVFLDGAVVKKTLKSHQGWVSSVAWSQSSEYEMISGSYDTTVNLWDTRRYFNM